MEQLVVLAQPLFVPSVADDLQRLAWPIELLALSLVATETLSPDTADRIEGILVGISSFVRNTIRTIFRVVLNDGPYVRSLSEMLPIYVYALLGFLSTVWVLSSEPTESGQLQLRPAHVLYGLLFLLLMWALLGRVLEWINDRVRGRALGVVGLWLAAIAFLMETYQLLELILGRI